MPNKLFEAKCLLGAIVGCVLLIVMAVSVNGIEADEPLFGHDFMCGKITPFDNGYRIIHKVYLETTRDISADEMVEIQKEHCPFVEWPK